MKQKDRDVPHALWKWMEFRRYSGRFHGPAHFPANELPETWLLLAEPSGHCVGPLCLFCAASAGKGILPVWWEQR